MKANAKKQIILWGCILALLVISLLYFLIGHWVDRREAERMAANPSPVVAEQAILYPRIAGEDLDVYDSPEAGAIVINFVAEGSWVDVTKEETVNDTLWSHISSPVIGWVRTESLSDDFSAEESVPPETAASEEEPEGPAMYHPDQVTELEIEWAFGTITIQRTDTNQIQISESNVSDKKHAMEHELKGGKLSINFCEDDDILFSTNGDFDKDLTILVPKDWNCAALELDVASADVVISDLVIGELEVDGASGKCSFENCTVDRMDLDTASGDVDYSGTLNILDWDAASANFTAVLQNTPQRMKLDTMSGMLDLTLPEDAGFSVNMDGLSTELTSDFTTTVKNGDYVCGDGSCRISLNTLSGEVIIRKAAAE